MTRRIEACGTSSVSVSCKASALIATTANGLTTRTATVATLASTASRSIPATRSIEARMDISQPLNEAHRLVDLRPDTLTMMASSGQKIIVHLDSGEVDLCGLKPSEGARLFWQAVALHYRTPEAWRG